jgi:hypothetical protein
MHKEKSPIAGGFMFIKSGVPELGDKIIHIEDWWDRISGKSWMFCNGNPAAMGYGIRAGLDHLPIDDEVLYGHIDGLGYLVHISELDTVHIPEQP